MRYVLAPFAVLAALLIAGPVHAQDVTLDSVRMEAVRSRAFIRGAETQLTKFLDLLDAYMGADTIAPTPTPDPEPDPEPLPEPGAGVVFESDFSAGDLTDGGKWTTTVGNGRANTIVDGATVPGWRTANALLATCDYSGSICQTENVGIVVEDGIIPVPAVGQSVNYGWDFNVVAPDGLTDTRTHPIEDGSSRSCGFAASCANWTFTVSVAQSGQWQAWWHFDQNGQNSGRTDRILRSVWLPRGQTFRPELTVTNRGSTFDVRATITDAQGNVVDDQSATGLNWGPQGAQGLTGFQAGHNGVFEDTGRDVDLYYEGAFRVEVR